MRLLCGLVAVVGVWASRAEGGPILYIDDGSNQLGTVDVGSGVVTVLGAITPVGGGVVTDIAFSPTGQLYGITFNNLYQINTTTGAATLIGSTGAVGGNALVFGTNGTLYLAGTSDTNLYTVNTATGATTVVGNIGFGSGGDLAFNGGSLYLSSTSGQLIRVNTTTRAGTLVGATGFSNVFGLATGDNGVLYGVSGTQIFSINPTTGAGTLVRNYGGGGLGGANGTAFFAEATSPIPEPATWRCSAGSRWRGWPATAGGRRPRPRDPARTTPISHPNPGRAGVLSFWRRGYITRRQHPSPSGRPP